MRVLCHLLDGHLLAISLAGLDLFAGLLDGLEDGLVWERFGSLDFGGLIFEGDVKRLDACVTKLVSTYDL